MRKIFFYFFLTLFIGIHCETAFGATIKACSMANSQDKCGAGCYWDGASCKICPENTFNSTVGESKCNSCPGSHPYSDIGSESKNSCYNKCSIRTIENGQKVPTDPDQKFYYPDNESSCSYNIVCDWEDDICNGFHLDNGKCVPNKQECSDSIGYGYKFWMQGSDRYSICRYTGCQAGYHPVYISQERICGERFAVACEVSTQKCSVFLSNCNYPGSVINGNAVWVNDSWDYSQCTCDSPNRNIENGIGSTSCPWAKGTGANTKWSLDCDTIISKCFAGYCTSDSPNACDPAPKGYYHEDTNDTECAKCPAGTTTDTTGAKNRTQCVMKRGTTGTKFCDSNGCFYLPGTGNIGY